MGQSEFAVADLVDMMVLEGSREREEEVLTVYRYY